MAMSGKEVVGEIVGDFAPSPTKSAVSNNAVETIEFELSSRATLGISIKGGIDHPYLVSKDDRVMTVMTVIMMMMIVTIVTWTKEQLPRR